MKFITSIVIHEMKADQMICSMVYDPHHQFLYTADSLGYVGKSRVEFTPDISIHLLKLYRCALDTIQNIFYVQNGAFIITSAVDLCIRVWEGADFRSVGFFSEDSVWALHDKSTWAKENPFEPNPAHFDTNRSGPMSSIISRSSYHPRHSGGSNHLSPSSSFNENLQRIDSFRPPNADPIFDAQSYMDYVDDFFQTELIRRPPKRFEQRDEPLPAPEVTPITMPSVIHPMDTINECRTIAEKPLFTGDSSRSLPALQVARSTPLPIPRLPSTVLPKKKKGLPRIAMLTPITT